MNNPTRSNTPTDRVAGGIEGLFSGLGNLLKTLGELAEKGEELKRSGTLQTKDGREVAFQYGFNIRTANGGRDLKVEPFGNKVQKTPAGATTVDEIREPVVDLFEEADHLLIVAEMPGIELHHLKTELQGDILTIEASNKAKRYRKEVLLPQTFDPSRLTTTVNSGVVEIRLAR